MGNLAGKSFCITGTLSKSRKTYIDLIEKLGGTFKSKISNRVNFVIVGPDAYTKDTAKLEKAYQLDLFLLTEQEFINMANGNN